MWYMSLLSGNGHASIRQDCDPTLLTSFPIPGDPKRRATAELLPNNFDSDSEDKVPPDPSLPCAVKEVVPELPCTREYWMPDRLCKTCYECELPFNVFRRKHHCRLCGQVFCHSCSSYSVDGRSVLLVGMVRACKVCHHQVSKLPSHAHAGPWQQVPTRHVLSTSFRQGDGPLRPTLHDSAPLELEQTTEIVVCQYPGCSPSIGSRYEEPDHGPPLECAGW